jgi:hypothetical protein
MASGVPAMMIHKAERSFRWPGIAAARVSAGVKDSVSGVGDCVLMDFKSGFFAVADSSERIPDGSRKFMTRFSAMLDAAGMNCRFGSNAVHTRCRDALVETARKVLEDTMFTECCTFTGIHVSVEGDLPRALLLHLGDSMLFIYSPGEGLRQVSKSNFWMAGRSHRFYQVEDIDVPPGGIFVLATDGMAGCTRDGMSARDTLALVAGSTAVDGIPDEMVRSIRREKGTDDAAFLALDPFLLTDSEVRIIMGGTTAAEEMRHREEVPGECAHADFEPLGATDRMVVI